MGGRARELAQPHAIAGYHDEHDPHRAARSLRCLTRPTRSPRTCAIDGSTASRCSATLTRHNESSSSLDAWSIGLRALHNAHSAAQESKLKDVGDAAPVGHRPPAPGSRRAAAGDHRRGARALLRSEGRTGDPAPRGLRRRRGRARSAARQVPRARRTACSRRRSPARSASRARCSRS